MSSVIRSGDVWNQIRELLNLPDEMVEVVVITLRINEPVHVEIKKMCKKPDESE